MIELLATVVVFAAAVVQGLAGIGYAMLCVPFLVLLDPHLVPGPMLVAMLSLSLVMAGAGRHAVDPREFVVLVPALLVGTVIGAPVLQAISRDTLSIVLALLVLIAVAVTWSGFSARLSRPNLALGGTFSGLMGTIAGIHGPPLAVLYVSGPADKARATIAWIFILGTTMSLTALHLTGQFGWPDLLAGLTLVPGTLVGYVVASRLRGRLSARFVRHAMLSLTAASGAVLLVRTLMQTG